MMIEAMIFDLDGTLVQTERLKALSYARAAVELCPYKINEVDVIEAFKEVVGLSRREVSLALMERFDLVKASRERMQDFGVSAPWQAFVQVRLEYYQNLIADPKVLRDNQWPHNVDLLNRARESGCKVALATMSRCPQVNRVIEILDLTNEFDFIATRDDVNQSKPNPEIYNLVASELEIEAENCLVIEDSPSGVKAALDAGMWCIAVSTPFTRASLHNEGVLEDHWIVDNPDHLLAVINEFVELK